MMAPNNIEYFYAAEETSERIWRIDEHLNTIYRWLVRLVSLGTFVAISLHLKSKSDMRSAAQLVSQRIDKEGAKATINSQGDVVVFMDGKVQKVFQDENDSAHQASNSSVATGFKIKSQ